VMKIFFSLVAISNYLPKALPGSLPGSLSGHVAFSSKVAVERPLP